MNKEMKNIEFRNCIYFLDNYNIRTWHSLEEKEVLFVFTFDFRMLYVLNLLFLKWIAYDKEITDLHHFHKDNRVLKIRRR